MAANVNNYISAGNAAVRKAVKIRKALADNKPRYGKMGEEAVTQAAKNVANVAQNNALMAQTSMDAKRSMYETDLKIKTEKAVANAKKGARKAGMLAGGVALLGAGAMQMNKKEEPNEMLATTQSMIDKLNSKLGDSETAINTAQSNLDALKSGNKPTTDTTSSTSSTTDSSQPTSTTKPDTETAPVPKGDTSQPTSSGGGGGGGGATASPDFKGIVDMAKVGGAKFPELVAAQWALESGWGKTPSGKNNYFGIKATPSESSTSKPTWEVENGQKINITAPFKNYASPQDSVNDLVTKWYKDFDGYKGVNRAGSAREAADLLVQESYATDPKYAEKLKDILADQGY